MQVGFTVHAPISLQHGGTGKSTMQNIIDYDHGMIAVSLPMHDSYDNTLLILLMPLLALLASVSNW